MVKGLLTTLLLFTNLCYAGVDTKYEDVICLAKNIYFEAGGESVQGQKAVTWVVLNRANSDSREWPDNVCNVVYQPSSNPNRPRACKFSWYCDGKSDAIPVEHQEQWAKAIVMAWEIYQGYDHYDPTLGATHYLRCDRYRVWILSLDFKVKIGDHCFYG